MIQPSPVYLLAGSLAEAMSYAATHGLTPQDFIYPVDATYLKSARRGARYRVLPDFNKRSDATWMRAEAELRDMVEEAS